MNLVCGHCGFSLKQIRSGVTVSETRKVGVAELPYKLWQADLLVCETTGCKAYGVNIIRTAGGPFAEHFHKNFHEKYEHNPPDFFWHERRGA